MTTGGLTLGEWDRKFWMIAFDPFSIKSFGMTQLFIHISEKWMRILFGYLHSERTLLSHVEIRVSA